MLTGTIENIKFTPIFSQKLKEFSFDDDLNNYPTRCLVKKDETKLAISKWVSPKRTRSYPYSRVYDTFMTSAIQKITIIPLVKDEGLDGDRDYLQWDTIALMSLLNVYIILGYYNNADRNLRNLRKPNKITNQKLDSDYIKQKINEVSNCHASALHWNLSQLKPTELNSLMQKVILSYQSISKKLNIKMHSQGGLLNFQNEIMISSDDFKNYSRNKAISAQNRESLTLQPKESIGVGEKSKILIKNYLGGYYYLTIDDLIKEGDELILTESKHSSNSALPSLDDIKDGLLKMIIFSNISKLELNNKEWKFNAALRLTSSKLEGYITEKSTDVEIKKFLAVNALNKKSELISELISGSRKNNFQLLIEGVK